MNIRCTRSLLAIAVLLIELSFGPNAFGQSKYFGNWPAGSSPKEIGKRLAENFVKRSFEYQSGKREFVIYPEACAWYGALNVAGEIPDRDLKDKLVQKFDPFLTPDGA